MERLTEFHGGIWGMSTKAVEKGYDRYSVFSKLAEYEDLEVTPEQIGEMDKLYADKCRELAEYQKIGSVEDFEFYKKEHDEESYEFCGEYGTEECQFKDLIDDYRNGLLLRMPCEVGTKVFCIFDRYTKCSEHNTERDDYSCQGCECLECDSHKEIYIQEQKAYSLDWIIENMKRFGKIVFLTREEAEAKLSEMEGKS